jgi:hypothetical protein
VTGGGRLLSKCGGVLGEKGTGVCAQLEIQCVRSEDTKANNALIYQTPGVRRGV